MRGKHGLQALVLLMAALIGIGAGAEQTVVVTDADAGREIVLAAGGALEVRIKAQPSTGFRWVVGQVDASVLAPQGEAVFESLARPSSGPALVGAPETEVLRFRAMAAGQTALTLDYIQPWRKNVPPAKQFLLHARGE